MDRTGRAGIFNSVGLLSYYSTPNLQTTEFGPAVIAAYPVYADDVDLKSIANDPALGYLYVTYTSRSGVYPGLLYYIQYMRSTDGGQTWEPPLAISSSRFCDASTVVVGPGGEVYIVWMDYQQGRLVGRRSTDHGVSFSPEFPIGSPLENFGARPKGWEVPIDSEPDRYNPYYVWGSNYYAPNYPRLAIDVSAGSTRGRLYAVWAERASGTISPAAQEILETEGSNESFAAPQVIPINTDVIGGADRDIYDNPNLDVFGFDGQAGQQIYLQADIVWDNASSPTSPTWFWTLYGTRPDGSVTDLYVGTMVRSETGGTQPAYITLPRIGRYYITVASTSSLFSLAYDIHLRAFQPAPGSVALDMRDIVITSSGDGGQTWSAPRRVNHGPGDSDQHMPNVAVDEHGRVYVAWYDRRGFALGDSVNAYVAVSQDGGLTFGPDQKLSGVPSYWSGSRNLGGFGEFVGDRIAVAAGVDFGVVAWADFRDVDLGTTDPNVYAARIVDVPTAVEDVSDLVATPSESGVRLTWHVNDVRAVSGLRVYRQGEDGAEIPLGAGDIVVRSTGAGEYLDATAVPGESYRYRLRIARGIGPDWLGPVAVTVPVAIRALTWRGAWPNPFSAATELHLAVPAVAQGSVRVYDVQGHEVRTIREGRFEAGELPLAWDGRDARGSAVSPGVYFLAARVGRESVRLKLARIR